MSTETDEQIAARFLRDKAVKNAWRTWQKCKRERRVIARLPAASPTPKSIIVTRDRVQDGSGGGIALHKHRKKRHRR